MTTLASSTQGDTAGLAVWRVEMRAGQSGPAHAFDSEQVWTVLEGGATVELGGEPFGVATGDTVVMPADVRRRVISDARTGFTAIVATRAGARAHVEGAAGQGAPACAVADGDRLLPAWVA
ncbi:cupin domain-containing protein [Streptomyces sp. NPDC004647]|uniref:cupin domain-containing protein n=1 Tax=Streptomyces sp. NPDC004647 TaxID=3154671 RepID=UPI0033B4DEBE